MTQGKNKDDKRHNMPPSSTATSKNRDKEEKDKNEISKNESEEKPKIKEEIIQVENKRKIN